MHLLDAGARKEERQLPTTLSGYCKDTASVENSSPYGRGTQGACGAQQRDQDFPQG